MIKAKFISSRRAYYIWNFSYWHSERCIVSLGGDGVGWGVLWNASQLPSNQPVSWRDEWSRRSDILTRWMLTYSTFSYRGYLSCGYRWPKQKPKYFSFLFSWLFTEYSHNINIHLYVHTQTSMRVSRHFLTALRGSEGKGGVLCVDKNLELTGPFPCTDGISVSATVRLSATILQLDLLKTHSHFSLVDAVSRFSLPLKFW